MTRFEYFLEYFNVFSEVVPKWKVVLGMLIILFSCLFPVFLEVTGVL